MKIVNGKENIEIIELDVPITKRNVNGEEYLGNYIIGEEEEVEYSDFKIFSLSKAKYIIENKLKKGFSEKNLEISITGGAFELDYFEELIVEELIVNDKQDKLDKQEKILKLKKNLLLDYLEETVKLAKKYNIPKIALTLPVKYILQNDIKRFKKIGITDIYVLAITTLDEYLMKAKANYMFSDIVLAVKKIRKNKMNVGAELAIGLAEEKREEIYMVEKMLKLHIKTLVLTPIIVFKNTELAKQFVRGKYEPLTISKLQLLIKEIVQVALEKNVKNIQFKTSLQESLIKTKYLQGAVITNIKEFIESEVCYDFLVEKIKKMNTKIDVVEIYVPKNKMSAFLGIDNSNIERLFEIYNTKLIVKPSDSSKRSRLLGNKIYFKVRKNNNKYDI